MSIVFIWLYGYSFLPLPKPKHSGYSEEYSERVCLTAEHRWVSPCNHQSMYTSVLTVKARAQAPVCAHGVLSVFVRNCHLCSSTILVCPHQGRATKKARPCICWQISLSAVGVPRMSTQRGCTALPPLWTNTIRIKMKSIITADVFISGYLITNFFQGFLKEFIPWASLSLWDPAL